MDTFLKEGRLMKKIAILIFIVCSYLITGGLAAQVHDRLPDFVKKAYDERMDEYRMAFPTGRGIKIRDLVDVVGEESIKISGFGVVSGLYKTGDKSDAAKKLIVAIARKQGIRIDHKNLIQITTAVVSISATVGPHQRTFDISVKSIGDAKSLQNGFLEASTLSPIGSEDVFAIAQGPLALGARHFETEGAGGADVQGVASVTIGHPTIGTIIEGGELLKEIPMQRLNNNEISLFVKYPNNRTATNIANIINDVMEEVGIYAIHKNASTIVIRVPKGYEGRDGKVTRLIADIGDLSTNVSREAVITIDQGTGVIAMTEGVKMEPGSIAVGGLTVTVSSDITPVTRQGKFGGETKFMDVPILQVEEDSANFLTLPAGTDLRKVQETLNALKLNPTSIISVFNAMHKAGMIHADIRVLPR